MGIAIAKLHQLLVRRESGGARVANLELVFIHVADLIVEEEQLLGSKPPPQPQPQWQRRSFKPSTCSAPSSRHIRRCQTLWFQ